MDKKSFYKLELMAIEEEMNGIKDKMSMLNNHYSDYPKYRKLENKYFSLKEKRVKLKKEYDL